MRDFFRLVAFLFHPLFMPVYGALIAMYFVSYFHFAIDPRIKYFLLNVMAVNVVVPAICMGTLVSKKILSDIQVTNKKERFIPFLLMISCYGLSYILLRTVLGDGYIPNEIYSMFLGVVISLFILLIISFQIKVSVHALGVSGVLGVITALAHKYVFYSPFDELFWIYTLIIVFGLVGASRIYTGNHNLKEIGLGGFIGFSLNYLIVINAFVL